MAALWDLLHELGHVMSGDPHITPGIAEPTVVKETQRRELDAWDNARSYLMTSEPELWTEKISFERRRAFCLKSYGIG